LTSEEKGRALCLAQGNSKHEYRDSKQYQNSNDQISKQDLLKVLNLEFEKFEFVSDFGFRISDFLAQGARLMSY